MANTLDLVQYAQCPLVDVNACVALIQALLSAAPKNPSPSVKEALASLRKSLKVLQTVSAQRAELLDTEDPRPHDNRVDIAFGSLYRRLASLAELAPQKYPRAIEAAKVLETIFVPAGDLTWLTLPYLEEWTKATEVRRRMKQKKLEARIDALAGPEFLQEIDVALKAYGHALHVTKSAPEAADHDSLLPALQDATRAVGYYGLQVVATVRTSKPATVKAAARVLRPIDEARQRAQRPTKSAAPAKPAAPASA